MESIELETMQGIIRRNRDLIAEEKRLRAIGEGRIGDNPDEQKTLSYFLRVVLEYLGICSITQNSYIESWGEDTPLPDGKAYIQTLCVDWRHEIYVDCQKYGRALHLTNPLRRILKEKFESHPNVQVCILTNGLEYEVYTDSTVEDELDEAPIYTFNILDLSDADLQVLHSLKTRLSTEVLQTIQQLQKY